MSTKDCSVWGSSAGARMVASIGSHGTARFGGADLPKPATVVMTYTAHSDLGLKEPPTFVVGGELDEISPPPGMEKRVAALEQAEEEVEYHKYLASVMALASGRVRALKDARRGGSVLGEAL